MEIEAPESQALDDATAALILQLQLEDIADIQSANKGKGRDGEMSDAEFAIAAYQQELQAMDNVLADRCMGRILTSDDINDNDVASLTESFAEENAAARDQALVHSLTQVNAPSAVAEQTTAADDQDDGLLARLSALFASGWYALRNTVHGNGPAAGESSAWAASRQTSSSSIYHHCTACDLSKSLFNVCQTPCGHFYCQGCMQTLFELSTTDETLFPPRCCREPIPLETVMTYLDSTVVRMFEEKSIEFETSDRTYCSLPTCSSFIAAVNITDEQATCRNCGTQTCTICKNNAHDGDCPQDIATQQLLEAAREHGWQRCYSCRRLVELDVGCHHMTCPCHAEFCYVCGERWKTCACDQWDEDRLMARAIQVVDRGRAEDGVARELQVDQAAAHLRERHNCVHEKWRYTPGPHQCEECYHNLPEYIFECRQCRILACNRCRRNRL